MVAGGVIAATAFAHGAVTLLYVTVSPHAARVGESVQITVRSQRSTDDPDLLWVYVANGRIDARAPECLATPHLEELIAFPIARIATGRPLPSYIASTTLSYVPKRSSFSYLVCAYAGDDFESARLGAGGTFATSQASGNPANAAPALSVQDARGYVTQALSRRFGGQYTTRRSGSGITGCSRIAAARVTCQVVWKRSQFRYAGHVNIWVAYEESKLRWFYAYRIARTDTTCRGSRCTVVFIVR